MTKRADIQSGRLIYTEHLGWIDKGHAKGDDTRALSAQLLSEVPNPLIKGYFLVNYSQAMETKHIRTGVHSQWKVKKGLSIETKRSIALSMMFCVSQQFEGMQPNSFYSVILPRDYLSMIKPKSKKYAFKIWGYYGPVGKYKNNELKTFISPDPEKFQNNAFPYKKRLPSYLFSIAPFSSYENDIVINTINSSLCLGMGLK